MKPNASLLQTLQSLSAVALVVIAVLPGVVVARDYVAVVGSSTVYPFAAVVAENFGRNSRFRTPRIEATGSGGGLKLFCAGIGTDYPDIANASRRIKRSEFDRCHRNGVSGIVEVKVGFDGIMIANAHDAPAYDLELRDIYLALAKRVPSRDDPGTLVENPHRNWNQVRADLPRTRIEVLGPPPTSGTRDAFVEQAMEGGCNTFPHIAALKQSDKNRYKALCHTLREDGAYIEAGENDNLIVRKLSRNPNAHGIFGFSFLDQNTDTIKGIRVGGVEPTFEMIASGDYPISRALYLYMKKSHINSIPGLHQFALTFIGDEAMGEDGYLPERGLIPADETERTETERRLRNLEVMEAGDFL